MKTGDFPQSIKIGPTSVAWLESEINEWINQKLANRCQGKKQEGE
ncbi:hypothetical protein CS369_22220 [Candidatus Symbiopectobacterium sp. 'North America']|nr:hypothetical protein [Candidatus Symbiopectobacterium sp. 'North America']